MIEELEREARKGAEIRADKVLLQHAIDLNPSYPTAHQWLGLLNQQIGDLEGAQPLLLSVLAAREELIGGLERGLLVTRFWYIRAVNPQTAQLTGLTRDGLFLIEKGKIAAPVVNLRFNESPLAMLKNTVQVGKAVRTSRNMWAALSPCASSVT